MIKGSLKITPERIRDIHRTDAESSGAECPLIHQHVISSLPVSQIFKLFFLLTIKKNRKTINYQRVQNLTNSEYIDLLRNKIILVIWKYILWQPIKETTQNFKFLILKHIYTLFALDPQKWKASFRCTQRISFENHWVGWSFKLLFIHTEFRITKTAC